MWADQGPDGTFGRFYEELFVGQRIRHWPGQTITQAADQLFCALTRGINPLHVDACYVRTKSLYAQPLVAGPHVYALMMGMAVPDVSGRGLNLGTDRLRHVRPLYQGDTLYAESCVRQKRLSMSRPGFGIVTLECTGYNQDEEVVCTFERSIMVPARGDGEDGSHGQDVG